MKAGRAKSATGKYVSASETTRSGRGSVLTQKDADKFKVSAKNYARKATASREKAQSKLISIGIYSKSGRLSKKYS